MTFRASLLALFTLSCFGATQQDKPFPAHRIIGNLYYVGTAKYASYLVTTPQGNILINSGFEENVPLTRASIEKLGFQFSDIKILLASHAHDDHIAGCAAVKKATNAKVEVMQGDEAETAGGGTGDFHYDHRWPPCAVDQVLHDGEQVKLGGSTLTAHWTPGHTKGCTTWTMVATEDGRPYNVVIVGSPNVNEGYKLVNNAKYPNIVQDFERTFRVLKSLPCDVFLGAHGEYYGLDEKYARFAKGAKPNPFIDPVGYKTFVTEKEKVFRQKLAAQR